MQILVAGINHRTAPIETRELFSSLAQGGESLAARLAREAGAGEALTLFTCNRFEIYCAGPACRLDPSAVASVVEGISGCAFRSEQWYFRTGEEALTHLFRVAAGLDAMVVGETQILSQLKMSYQRAWEAGTTGPVLNRALHRAFFVAKRVHTECRVVRGPVSVASVAAAHAAEIVSDASRSRALVLGAGEVGTCAARQLVREGFGSVVIAGRTPSRTEAAAEEAGATAVPWKSFPSRMAESDVVIAATSAGRPIIGPSSIMTALKTKRARPLSFIDLGAPRNVSPSAAKIGGVRVITVDDLKPLAEKNLSMRAEAAGRAEHLVAAEAGKFFSELSGRRFSRTLAALSEKISSIGKREVERLFRLHPDLDEKHRKAIEKACRSIVSKILADPARYLKDEAHVEGERFISADVIKRVFDLP